MSDEQSQATSSETNKAAAIAFLESLGDRNAVDKLVHEDYIWEIPGTTKYSGRFQGNDDVYGRLLGPLAERCKPMGRNDIKTVIAEGDFVVIEAVGVGKLTKDNKPYNNTYCLVYKFVDGKIKHFTEYCDTELVTSVFGK